jgi:hypothetical protein
MSIRRQVRLATVVRKMQGQFSHATAGRVRAHLDHPTGLAQHETDHKPVLRGRFDPSTPSDGLACSPTLVRPAWASAVAATGSSRAPGRCRMHSPLPAIRRRRSDTIGQSVGCTAVRLAETRRIGYVGIVSSCGASQAWLPASVAVVLERVAREPDGSREGGKSSPDAAPGGTSAHTAYQAGALSAP